ncbi:VCBS repeat-containing protein [Rubritalea tangerina]|uniref:VCBS repeat-containing protein n=1 Tax=Rubritalea tangerina TaxID=430798 RepID=A0ABW4ZER1_9BACT
MKSPLLILPALTLLSLSPLNAAPFAQLPSSKHGVEFTHTFDTNHPRADLYHSGFAVGAICLGDINGDNILDLYLVNGPKRNKLFLGKGQLEFAESHTPFTQSNQNWGTGAALVDIDNDGDLDLYQCNFAKPNQLFLNDGKGSFTELPDAAGLNVADASMTPYFADIDNDGDLDLFLLCNRYYNPKGRPETPPFVMQNGKPLITPEFEKFYEIIDRGDGSYNVDSYGRADYLFLNLGNNPQGIPSFKNISENAGVHLTGEGLSALWWDYDTDGDLDLYVANDFLKEDRLFRNDGPNPKGIPQFTNVIAETFPSISWSSMGSDFTDINHDGLPDLFSVDMAATTHFMSKVNMGSISPERRKVLETGNPRQSMRNHLFINSNASMFQEAAFIAGIASSNWSWSAKFGDLDNDGFQDLFVSNGMSRNFTHADISSKIGDLNTALIGNTLWALHKDQPPMLEKNLVFKNQNGLKFTPKNDWGLNLLGMSYASAMGDLDNDGDLDLVVSDLGKSIKIYQNNATSGNSLSVSLKGTTSNAMAIGTKLELVDSNGTTRTRWLNPWTGFQSQHDSKVHFGLGSAHPSSLRLTWPSGKTQSIKLQAKNRQHLTIAEEQTTPPIAQQPSKATFQTLTAPDFTHREKIFDDFAIQPLLPQKLSQLGPCLAAGDVDNDGDLDFFVGGGNEQAGALFLNQNNTYIKSPQNAFDGLAKYADDTAALWFDADSDGDLDLLVITGGNEYKADDILYYDHLYLNQLVDGKVTLTEAPDDAFPALIDSGSCVAAHDFDADGDLDLFIGSRAVPHDYPNPPKNRLLRNESTQNAVRFTEITPNLIKYAGLVTDAQWADLDGNGSAELCLATDWGPIKIFQFSQNQWSSHPASKALAKKSGWWRSIACVDVDNDGDLDIVAGNSSTNTKYKSPNPNYPALLYYGDMDGSGNKRIVEAKIQKSDHTPLPLRGRY